MYTFVLDLYKDRHNMNVNIYIYQCVCLPFHRVNPNTPARRLPVGTPICSV